MKLELRMRWSRDTKNTKMFEEVNASGQPAESGEAVIGRMYIQKSALPDPAPRTIRVTVEHEEP
jgi:hypothetical protein